MQIPMIAYFSDARARVVATVAAVAARKDVRLSVEGCMIVLGIPSEDPRNLILFFGGDEDKSFFVDNGATFVGPFH